MTLPTRANLQVKRRHLLITELDEASVCALLLRMLGVLGYARAAPVFVKDQRNVILSVVVTELDDVLAAFELSPAGTVVRVSGTLEQLHRNL